jgi:hypothetical protein
VSLENVQRFDDLERAKRDAAYLGKHFDHEMLVWPTERVREWRKWKRCICL